jgi:hypothetical protein
VPAALPRSSVGVCGKRSSAVYQRCRRRCSALGTLARLPLLPRRSVAARGPSGAIHAVGKQAHALRFLPVPPGRNDDLGLLTLRDFIAQFLKNNQARRT